MATEKPPGAMPILDDRERVVIIREFLERELSERRRPSEREGLEIALAFVNGLGAESEIHEPRLPDELVAFLDESETHCLVQWREAGQHFVDLNYEVEDGHKQARGAGLTFGDAVSAALAALAAQRGAQRMADAAPAR